MRRGGSRIEALIGRRDGKADARVADQVPPHEVRVAAVVRVAERTLKRVRQQEVEKDRRAGEACRGIRLDLAQHGVLLGAG